ncbi:hypothetical protein V2J09_022752 [Rumex salicifolius]
MALVMAVQHWRPGIPYHTGGQSRQCVAHLKTSFR